MICGLIFHLLRRLSLGLFTKIGDKTNNQLPVRLIIQKLEFAAAYLSLPRLGLFTFRFELSTPKTVFKTVGHL